MSQPIDFVRGDKEQAVSGLLPTEFEQAARRRLLLTMAVGGAIFLLYLILYLTVWYNEGFWFARIVSAITVVLCFGGALYLARGAPRTRQVYALTVICQIGMCLSVALMEYLGLWKYDYRVAPDTVSWTCVIILLFPLLAPMPARLTALTAFASAAANTVAMGIAGLAIPQHLPETSIVIGMLLPPYVCAACAIIPARVMARLGAAAKQAKRLGSYQLEERIGRGGMGEVWRASHALLKRAAAVKLIAPDQVVGGADAETLFKRFAKEARTTANLRSPHTVEVFDFGTTGEGAFYYVMELLEGFDLEQLVDRYGPVAPERAIHLLAQACDSLAEAHAAGLIHRDIKPANLIVSRCGPESDFVKVLDFGLVKDVAPLPAEQLTAGAAFVGTPAFAPPELSVGDRPLDHRADLYALGCVAYWLVTGRLVFEDTTAMGVLIKHVNDEPVPPSRVTELALPEGFDELVLQCLDKDPDKRPADATEVRDRLLGLDREPWTRASASSWWSTHTGE